LSASCCCMLYLLQISGMTLHSPSPAYLLFRVLLDACPFCFLQYSPTSILPVAIPVLFYLEFMWGGACPPLSSAAVLSKHTGGRGATPAFSGQLVYLQFA
jgi:hypothetical protein